MERGEENREMKREDKEKGREKIDQVKVEWKKKENKWSEVEGL